jgi:hypothetical protein
MSAATSGPTALPVFPPTWKNAWARLIAISIASRTVAREGGIARRKSKKLRARHPMQRLKFMVAMKRVSRATRLNHAN